MNLATINLTPEQIKRLCARDLRMASVHEAAHVVVCNALGGYAKAALYRRPEETWATQRTVGGETWAFALPARGFVAAIALAGYVAERISNDPEVDWFGVVLYANSSPDDRPSDSDMDLAGEVTLADWEAAHGLVALLWRDIEAMAAELAAALPEAA